MGFVICAGWLLTGCGENTPDQVRFALPSTSIDISSDNPQWRSAPLSAVPAMVCAGPWAVGDDCCAPPPGVPATGVDCQRYPVACDPSNNLCALTFDVENKTNVDLLSRFIEMGGVDGRVFARVQLSSLRTWVDDLDVLPIRNAALFIGPTNAGATSSPDVTFLATVELTEQATSVTPTGEAQEAFSRFARDYRMPFALWVSAHVVVPSGSTPVGSITVHVDGRAQAWY